jgi:hypothetical protein
MRFSERVMKVMGLLGFVMLGTLIAYTSGSAALAGNWSAAILIFLFGIVVVGSVIHMNTAREMTREDQERFGPSASWGGKFFWRVYLNSRRRRSK